MAVKSGKVRPRYGIDGNLAQVLTAFASQLKVHPGWLIQAAIYSYLRKNPTKSIVKADMQHAARWAEGKLSSASAGTVPPNPRNFSIDGLPSYDIPISISP